MDIPPPLSSPHKYKRIRKRSTSIKDEQKMDDLESALLAAGIKPGWLKIHRIIGKRYVCTYVLYVLLNLCKTSVCLTRCVCLFTYCTYVLH